MFQLIGNELVLATGRAWEVVAVGTVPLAAAAAPPDAVLDHHHYIRHNNAAAAAAAAAPRPTNS